MNKKEKISITLNPNDLLNFKIYCKKNGFKVSSRINILINSDVIKNRRY